MLGQHSLIAQLQYVVHLDPKHAPGQSNYAGYGAQIDQLSYHYCTRSVSK